VSTPTTENQSTIVVFDAPGFPTVDCCPVDQSALAADLKDLGTVSWVDVKGLGAALAANPSLFITPHGSAFPKSTWLEMLNYLRRGGHWLNLGGALLTRPVRREGNEWRLEEPQSAYGKELMIRHVHEVPLSADCTFVQSHHSASLSGIAEIASALKAQAPTRAWTLQVMLTHDSKIMPDDPGSEGPRDAILHPLVEARAADGRNLAAPVVALDHIHGPFVGGRWVLASCDGSPWPPALLRFLVRHALMPVVQIDVDPGLACYVTGEEPTAEVRAAGFCEMDLELDATVIRTTDEVQVFSECTKGHLSADKDMQLRLGPIGGLAPGLYRIVVRASHGGTVIATAENGFWIEEVGQITAPAPLMIDGDYFTREGQPYPVTGTTYMSTVSHRNWLLEPTPIAWERDFAAMKAAGVNMVRTGLWMGWRHAMPDASNLDQGVIRALRAFLLTAARHDMPVIMTLFAFLPESWGGLHPYIDPKAVGAQCAFASALAKGVADAPHLLWDLINEPSVAPREHLWSCRPSGDSCEAAAWREWLTAQGLSDDEWRERWRLTPSASLSLPSMKDFTDRHAWDDASPLRCMDFVRFSQDIFTQWADKVAATLRSCTTPPKLVTVGQDEAGTRTSPSPHFHGSAVDFTSNHSWWNNDDLLWDTIGTKLPGKPHLMEETGIMLAETADGLAMRSQEFVAALLERKLALSFAGGGAGFIQWLWNTNIYINSDNEAAIGLLRADGSEKPELPIFRRMAAFMARNAARMTGRKPERVALLIPHSNLFSVRETAQAATRRSVRTLEYRLGLACRGVSEYAPEAIGDAALIVLPAARILKETCWQEVLKRVRAGATLLLSGYLEADEYWRMTRRLVALGIELKTAPIMHEEYLTLNWTGQPVAWRIAMPLHADGIPKIEKAVALDGMPLTGTSIECGQGRILFTPVPVEHALSEEHTEAVYRLAAECAGLQCGKREGFEDGGPGLLIRVVEFAESSLFILVNESNVEQTAKLRGAMLRANPAWETLVTVPENGTRLVFLESQSGSLLDDSLLDPQSGR